MPEPHKPYNNVRLGVFVLGGLLLFIGTLYIIGKNEHLFGSNFELRARFTNVGGLTTGDNIRFAGIQAGTVRHITLKDDSTIEVTLLIDKALRPYIRKNALASIGNEGLMGNKIINITPVKGSAALAEPGDLLSVQQMVGSDEMLATLAKTNDNIELISEDLRVTIRRLNNSTAFWTLLSDSGLTRRLQLSMAGISRSAANAEALTNDIRAIIADVKAGKGSLGNLLRDTTLAGNLNQAADRIRSAGAHADELAITLNNTVTELQNSLIRGQGVAHSLLQDPALAEKLNASMENIRQGTAAFNQDMQALQHNFLFRGYFRRLEKKEKKKAL
ncbi:MAG TPA: MlaD family protein [Puia sp.]|nr:MlaD family protein [Puia sp.]